jgi:hypothetical protein
MYLQCWSEEVISLKEKYHHRKRTNCLLSEALASKVLEVQNVFLLSYMLMSLRTTDHLSVYTILETIGAIAVSKCQIICAHLRGS